MCVNKLEICCMVQVRGCVWVEACRRQDMMQKIRCRIPFSWFGWRFGNGPELPWAYFFLPPVHRHFTCPHCRCVKSSTLSFSVIGYLYSSWYVPVTRCAHHRHVFQYQFVVSTSFGFSCKSPTLLECNSKSNCYTQTYMLVRLYVLKCCYVSGELLAGERNLNCPDAENSSWNTRPFCQNSKGEFKLLNNAKVFYS